MIKATPQQGEDEMADIIQIDDKTVLDLCSISHLVGLLKLGFLSGQFVCLVGVFFFENG